MFQEENGADSSRFAYVSRSRNKKNNTHTLGDNLFSPFHNNIKRDLWLCNIFSDNSMDLGCLNHAFLATCNYTRPNDGTWWIMNWKVHGKKWPRPNLMYLIIPVFAWRDSEESRTMSGEPISGPWCETRTFRIRRNANHSTATFAVRRIVEKLGRLWKETAVAYSQIFSGKI